MVARRQFLISAGCLWASLLLPEALQPASAGSFEPYARFTQQLDGRIHERIERETGILLGESRWTGSIAGKVVVPLAGVDIREFDRRTEFFLCFGDDPRVGACFQARLGEDRRYRRGRRAARFVFQTRDKEKVGVETLVVALRWNATQLTVHIRGRATRGEYPASAPIPLENLEVPSPKRLRGYNGLVLSFGGREAALDLVANGDGYLQEAIFNGEKQTVGALSLDVTSYPRQFHVEPPVLEFYQARVGETQTRILTVTNTRGNTVTLTAETPPSPFAVSASGAPPSLGPGESVAIEVSFTPEDKRFYYETLILRSDSLSRPVLRVPLIGRVGYAPPPHARPHR